MVKKYNAKDILISLLKACGYLAGWIAVSFLVTIIAEYALKVSSGVTSESALTEIILEKTMSINLLVDTVVILVFVLFYLIRKKSFSEKTSLYSVPKKILYSALFLGIGAQIVLILAVSMITLPESWVEKQGEVYYYVDTSIVSLLSTVIVGPITEEIIFRGLVLNRLEKAMPKWVAIVLSAVLFASFHSGYYAMIYSFCLAILMGWLFVKFDSLLPPIFVHIAFNGVSFYLQKTDYISMIFVIFGVAIFIVELVFLIRQPGIRHVYIKDEDSDSDQNLKF